MQISLGKALCTGIFFSFGGVKKGDPLRRVLQTLAKSSHGSGRVGGGMCWMDAEVSWGLGGRLSEQQHGNAMKVSSLPDEGEQKHIFSPHCCSSKVILI